MLFQDRGYNIDAQLSSAGALFFFQIVTNLLFVLNLYNTFFGTLIGFSTCRPAQSLNSMPPHCTSYVFKRAISIRFQL
jgi:hypothetical protein